MQEVIPSCSIGHSDVSLASRTPCYPIYIGYQSKVSFKTAWREKFREERGQQSLIEVVVDLSAINTLWQKSHDGIPRHFLWWQVGAALKTKKCVTESEHTEFLDCLTSEDECTPLLRTVLYASKYKNLCMCIFSMYSVTSANEWPC